MRFKISRFLVCAILLAYFAIPLASQQPELSNKWIEEIETLVTQVMARDNIPGLSVAVAVKDNLRWANGYGLADVENSVPAKALTTYRLASISKPITAVAIMQLAENGKLNLDAPVQKYVPGFPEKPWPVTVRHLLGHLGGIRHYNNEAEVNSTRHYSTLLEPLRIFRDDPLVAEPGTKYSYTTYGYLLLGAIVEVVSGQTFMDYVGENIFEPASMSHIQVDDVYAIIPNRARGYQISSKGRLENCALADTSNKIPGGGMISPPEDLVRFALALRNGVLLKPAMVEQMFTPQKLNNGQVTEYGLGWEIDQDGKQRIVGHSGGQQGVSTMLLMLPQQGSAVTIMANLEHAGIRGLASAILRILAR